MEKRKSKVGKRSGNVGQGVSRKGSGRRQPLTVNLKVNRTVYVHFCFFFPSDEQSHRILNEMDIRGEERSICKDDAKSETVDLDNIAG